MCAKQPKSYAHHERSSKILKSRRVQTCRPDLFPLPDFGSSFLRVRVPRESYQSYRIARWLLSRCMHGRVQSFDKATTVARVSTLFAKMSDLGSIMTCFLPCARRERARAPIMFHLNLAAKDFNYELLREWHLFHVNDDYELTMKSVRVCRSACLFLLLFLNLLFADSFQAYFFTTPIQRLQ